jgi:hydrogenase maturation protease
MIYVLGMGNELLKDDGIGVYVARELQKRDLPKEVEVIEVGTAILRMLPQLINAQKLIIIDAIKANGHPGTIYSYTPGDRQPIPQRSVHDLQFDEVMAYLQLLGHQPEIEFYGMEPKEIVFSMDLSDEIEMKIPQLTDYIYKRLFELGNI